MERFGAASLSDGESCGTSVILLLNGCFPHILMFNGLLVIIPLLPWDRSVLLLHQFRRELYFESNKTFKAMVMKV